jgi:hypothetical protein
MSKAKEIRDKIRSITPHIRFSIVKVHNNFVFHEIISILTLSRFTSKRANNNESYTINNIESLLLSYVLSSQEDIENIKSIYFEPYTVGTDT